MKDWSTNWKSSANAGKQRKYRHKAPLHIRGKFVSSHLSKELKQKHGKRSMPLRKGDTVKIVRGRMKGETGKIDIIDRAKLKVQIEGKRITKRDGTEVPVSFQPSNLIVTSLNMDDKFRLKKKGAKEVKTESKQKGMNEKVVPKKKEPAVKEEKKAPSKTIPKPAPKKEVPKTTKEEK
jgi:large subunit ribosomal protein L24